jgi:quercetin dioxygenase-like cupin family protein
MRSAKFWLAGSLLVVVGAAAVATFARARASCQASRPESQERARVTFSTPLPKLDGTYLKATLVEVRYGPGESSAPHTHPCPVVGYVLQGAIRTQINGEAEAIYTPGESFYEPLGILYARIALGAAFLSALAARFGIYDKHFSFWLTGEFMQYTAEVNSFMPAATIPYVAWTATAAELFFGVTLILGVWPRYVALGAAVLLAVFGSAMAVSFGIKSALDYSVFSASAAAVLLAVFQPRSSGQD